MNKTWIALSLSAGLFALAGCQPQQAAQVPAPAEQASASTAAAAGGSFHGTDMRKEDIGGDFTMTDGDGKPFTLSSLKGKSGILAFGYTHCPDIRPAELLT